MKPSIEGVWATRGVCANNYCREYILRIDTIRVHGPPNSGMTYIAPTLSYRNPPSNTNGIGLTQAASWGNPHAAQDSFADPRSDSDGGNLVIGTTKYFAGAVAPSDSSSLAFDPRGVGTCWAGFKNLGGRVPQPLFFL